MARRHQVSVRFSKEEFHKIRSDAEGHGYTHLSSYLRNIVDRFTQTQQGLEYANTCRDKLGKQVRELKEVGEERDARIAQLEAQLEAVDTACHRAVEEKKQVQEELETHATGLIKAEQALRVETSGRKTAESALEACKANQKALRKEIVESTNKIVESTNKIVELTNTLTECKTFWGWWRWRKCKRL